MAQGALSLTTPRNLLDKFKRELDRLKHDPYDADAALNALRDGYHLCDWVWVAQLEDNKAAQMQMAQREFTKKKQFAEWVAERFPPFEIVREICNGSKHFAPKTTDKVAKSYESGWEHQRWDEGAWDAPPGFMVIADNQHVSVNDTLKALFQFWGLLFEQQGW